MNKISGWILCVLVAIITVCFIVFLARSPQNTKPLSDNVIIAIIGSVAAVITIFSSIMVAKLTNNANEKQQRDMEARKIKQEKYNVFLELFAKVVFYKNRPNDLHENHKLLLEYAVEFARLPLYASEQVVELFQENIGKEKDIITDLLKLIRIDLCDSTYREFKTISNIQLQCLKPEEKENTKP